MKQKILYWFSTHCGFICCCLLLCFIVADIIKGDYHSIILMLPFLITWAMYAQKEKECEYARKRLQEADDFANDMKGKLDELEKLINEAALDTEKYIIASKVYLHRWLREKNKVMFCKFRTSATNFEKRDRYLSFVIEIFEKEYKDKFGCEV